MTGFDVYRLYLAMHRHFRSDSYDFFKYHGKVNVKQATYNNRNDCYFFDKLGRLYNYEELVGIMLSHFSLSDNGLWVGNLLSSDSNISYLKWSKKIQAMSFEFNEDILKIKDTNISFNDLFICENTQHPPIVKMLISDSISIETFIIIDKLIHFIKAINVSLIDDFCWEILYKRIKKYAPFLKIDDLSKYKSIILKHFSK